CPLLDVCFPAARRQYTAMLKKEVLPRLAAKMPRNTRPDSVAFGNPVNFPSRMKPIQIIHASQCLPPVNGACAGSVDPSTLCISCHIQSLLHQAFGEVLGR